jgi:hypothetical protein
MPVNGAVNGFVFSKIAFALSRRFHIDQSDHKTIPSILTP